MVTTKDARVIKIYDFERCFVSRDHTSQTAVQRGLESGFEEGFKITKFYEKIVRLWFHAVLKYTAQSSQAC